MTAQVSFLHLRTKAWREAGGSWTLGLLGGSIGSYEFPLSLRFIGTDPNDHLHL